MTTEIRRLVNKFSGNDIRIEVNCHKLDKSEIFIFSKNVGSIRNNSLDKFMNKVKAFGRCEFDQDKKTIEVNLMY